MSDFEIEMSEHPCKYCGHWPDPADDFAYVAVCNGQTFCGNPVCHGNCYQCRLKELQARIDELEAEIKDTAEIAERDGKEQAAQEIDIATGGDGEYRWSNDHDRCCADYDMMVTKIAVRFSRLKAERRWIPINRSCPPGADGDYLIWVKFGGGGFSTIGCVLNGVWQHDSAGITHYMPLPDPPVFVQTPTRDACSPSK